MPGQRKPPDIHHRKRPPDVRMSGDSSAFYESDSESQVEQRFTVQVGQRLK